MSTPVLIRKIRSALWHARHRWDVGVNHLRQLLQERRQDRIGHRWFNEFDSSNIDVLVGANFVDLGGTRNHMHCIAQHSSLRVALAPAEFVMGVLSPGQFIQRFHGRMSQLNCRRLQAVHSHVFPFFIQWCYENRKRYGTRWVHTHHNWYYPEFGRNGIEPWQEEFNKGFLFAGENADVFLCVSKSQQNFLHQSFGLNAYHIPNGVDVDACLASNAVRFEHKTGIKRGFILFVGRNDPVKDPEFFVQLAAEMPDKRFVIAGQGISRNVIENEWRLPIPPNLDVLGQLSHADVQDAIAASSVLVLCSRREGLPTLVLEGLVGGRPVVVPDEQGCVEAINDGEFGFIYQQRSLRDCVNAVCRALADSSKIHEAKQHTISTYSWKSLLKQLDAVYKGWTPPGQKTSAK
jgi:glycosyltransferase involved in cell wall biosynthesis